jgi:cellulose biosynthesis protein BcsQ
MVNRYSETKIILIVVPDKKLSEEISSLKLKNYSIVFLNNTSFIEHYLEEYIPEFVILSAEFKNYGHTAEYILNNALSELIIIDEGKKEMGVFGGIYLYGVRNAGDMEKILTIIDDLNSGRFLTIKDNYKLLSQQVITFYSIQGGVGKTSILFNFAWYIKNIIEGRILIMDLNFCEGPSDLTINLGLNLSTNLSIFMEEIASGEGSFESSIVGLNNSDKIDILQPPLSIYQSDKFNVDMLNSIVYSARNKYDVIIADVPFRYDNISLEMLNLSTTSILVLSPDMKLFPRVSDFKKFLPKDQKKGIIFNRVGNYSGLYINEYSRMLDMPVYNKISFIPEERRNLIKCGRSSFNILNLQKEIENLGKVIF